MRLKLDLREYSFHDSLLKDVIENTKTDEYRFCINWPKDWENNRFIDAELVFENVLNYEVHEIPFEGNPTILGIYENGNRIDYKIERKKIKIETNAGYRTLDCTDVKLVEKHDRNNNYNERLDAWIDGNSICVIANTSCGDPLDLNENEVAELILKLQKCIKEMH
jgi:hypothetical protein